MSNTVIMRSASRNLNLNLESQVASRLNELAAKKGIETQDYVKDLLIEHLEDQHDLQEGLKVLERHKSLGEETQTVSFSSLFTD